MTKKMLVPIDLDNPKKKQNGFVYPNFEAEGSEYFIEIDSNKLWKHGMVVYTGKDLTNEEIFSRIVDSGKKVSSVDMYLKKLDEFLGQVKQFKIGDKLFIEDSPNGYKLLKIENKS